jgi:hypothetical protein
MADILRPLRAKYVPASVREEADTRTAQQQAEDREHRRKGDLPAVRRALACGTCPDSDPSSHPCVQSNYLIELKVFEQLRTKSLCTV